VIYRHLMRLKQSGHHISCVLLSNNLSIDLSYIHKDFDFIPIQKKRWDPPLRRKIPFFTALRTRLTLKRLIQALHLNSDDLVIGVLGEVCNLLFYQLKKHFNTPYYLFYHDDVVFNRYKFERILSDAQMFKVLRAADHIFSVSDQMNAMLEEINVTYSSTLYPIPDGYNGPLKSQENISHHLQLMAAGMMETVHFSMLKKIGKAAFATGGALHCITDQPPEKLSTEGFVNVIPRFATTTGLFDFILKGIDIVTVFYSFDKWHEPRMMSSFPSKLVEFSHMGLPILIIAPKQSALGLWARKNNWLGYLDTAEVEPISRQIEKYKEKNYYKSCCEQSLRFANTMFNPDVLHQQFVKYMDL